MFVLSGLLLISLVFFSGYIIRNGNLNVLNPLNLFSFILKKLLNNKKLILFFIIIILIIFFLYLKFKKENIINEIFNDLVLKLKSRSANNEEGLSENEIINIYCEKYGFEYNYFLITYFKSLDKLRQKNPHIKKIENLSNGKKSIVWFYSDY